MRLNSPADEAEVPFVSLFEDIVRTDCTIQFMRKKKDLQKNTLRLYVHKEGKRPRH
jgi:hypothetical protein